MDLREYIVAGSKRHPWETSRVKAVKSLLRTVIHRDLSVLDIGCGDGYLCRELLKEGVKDITALDINLSAGEIAEFAQHTPDITYLNDYAALGQKKFDLILLLDVMEHVKEDKEFLLELVDQKLSQRGHVLVTVPLFPILHSAHDRFLGHHRRYTLQSLAALTESSRLQCLASGYLFTSLLLPRLFSVFMETFFRMTPSYDTGVGNWSHGPFLTKIIESILVGDNNVSLAMNRYNIKMPGLTGWILCKKPQS